MERVLADFIEQEKQGRLYCCSEHDRLILGRMFEEINRKLGDGYSLSCSGGQYEPSCFRRNNARIHRIV